jgi:hypothetical protein
MDKSVVQIVHFSREHLKFDMILLPETGNMAWSRYYNAVNKRVPRLHVRYETLHEVRFIPFDRYDIPLYLDRITTALNTI